MKCTRYSLCKLSYRTGAAARLVTLPARPAHFAAISGRDLPSPSGTSTDQPRQPYVTVVMPKKLTVEYLLQNRYLLTIRRERRNYTVGSYFRSDGTPVSGYNVNAHEMIYWLDESKVYWSSRHGNGRFMKVVPRRMAKDRHPSQDPTFEQSRVRKPLHE
ncbi:hypothetical protein BU23DRAFT_571343 [Bimuria novae-zelandiae CBS 107.79]|uniref:Uncharacterized protein n=1 Tax=Bimuria novae-zelandiae CBS 107.79 TaxID=1447943 RepID=A0A6A5UY05_9PLEO|nr:hypothetical protein BU23DRAFT_571343 [Bimuria novae-zelandiae CBS 107.79]